MMGAMLMVHGVIIRSGATVFLETNCADGIDFSNEAMLWSNSSSEAKTTNVTMTIATTSGKYDGST